MKAALLKLARSTMGALLLHVLLTVFPSAIPGKKLYQSKTLIAIEHPSPAYPVHLLLIPIPVLRGPESLGEKEGAVVREVLNAAHHIIDKLQINEDVQLIMNGGAYQDVAILHIHLIQKNAPDPSKS